MPRKLISALGVAAALSLGLPLSALAEQMVDYGGVATPPAAADTVAPVEVRKPLPPKPELVKTSDGKIYIKTADGVVAPVANADTLRQLAPNTPTPKPIKDLGAYRVDATITADRINGDGTLKPSPNPTNVATEVVKEPSKPAVYIKTVCNGATQLRPIQNWRSFLDLRLKPENIKQVSAREVQAAAVAAPVSSDKVAVQYEGEATIVDRTGGAVATYASASQLAAAGKDPCAVIKLPPRFVPVEQPGGIPTSNTWGASNENYMDISVYSPPNYGYGYGMPGVAKGFVALRQDGPAAYLPAEATTWQMSEATAQNLKEALPLCQKYFPGTWLAQAMKNYNFTSAWYEQSGVPINSSWYLFSCVVPPSLTNAATTDAQARYDMGAKPVPSDLGAISYWYGKVNIHSVGTGDSVSWAPDPDGSSGANVATLGYCQKWFPGSNSVQYIGNTLYGDWKDAGLRNSWKGGGATYACRSASQPTIAAPGMATVAPTPTPTPLPITPSNPAPTKPVYPWDRY